jgi:hypothetical protein
VGQALSTSWRVRVSAVRALVLDPAVLALHPELPVIPSSEVGWMIWSWIIWRGGRTPAMLLDDIRPGPRPVEELLLVVGDDRFAGA